MMDRHGEWTERLSAFLSGDLDPATRALVERHLTECPRCTETLAELERVVSLAREAPALAAPRDLWPDIARSIAVTPAGADVDSEVIVLPTARDRPVRRPTPARLRLAAAAVILIVTSAGGGWWVASAGADPAPAHIPVVDPGVVGTVSDDAGAPADLAAQLGVLEQIVASARETLDPNTVLVLERNLNTIERAIADSRQALATDPGNAFLAEHLERMYRRKLTYLREAVRVAEWAG